MTLAGKVALVTGGGSGIGKAICDVFADAKARVVIADWDEAAGRASAKAIQSSGGSAAFVHTDVSDGKQAEAAVHAAEQLFGGLHILVNNAAVQVLGSVLNTDEAAWERMQSVNLKGVFLMTRAALPALTRSGDAAIVNIASILGLVGDPDLAAYGAMKGGVLAFTKATALGYGRQGVRVNAICPGDVNTPMVAEYFDKSDDPAALRAEVASKYALGRIAEPHEIAQVALFLASSAASFLTGSVIVADGGLTSKCY